MDQQLIDAITKIHPSDGWVHLATIGKKGEPHVVPVMMGIEGDYLTFSLTGKQKKRNVERDPRVCVSIAQAGSLAHIIIWGTMELRHDAEAQGMWDRLLIGAFGAEGHQQRARTISLEGTSLGLLRPTHYRLFQV